MKLKYFSVGNIWKNVRWIGVGYGKNCLFFSFWKWGVLIGTHYDPHNDVTLEEAP